jgi:murein DD-endopeptidase MepM/ murein hydrolase activator NlpD
VFLSAAILLTQVAASPTPTPPPPSASPSPSQSILLNQVRQKLGDGLASALGVQGELEGSLRVNVAEQAVLSAQIAAADQRIAALEMEIERLQAEMDAITIRIGQERVQIAALARTIYAQPDSLLLVLAQARNLNDAITRGSEFVLAGRRAQTIRIQLEADLKRMQADQAQAQADRDEQANKRVELESMTDQLMDLHDQAIRIGDQLQAKMDEIRAELAIIGNQSPDVAGEVQAQLLADAEAIIGEARLVTWQHIQLLLRTQAKLPGLDLTPRLGAGTVPFIWPVANAVLTQGFGPSHYSYEPPYGPYPHFHTGIDLAAPLNSPVVAAAAGVVLVVGRDPWGYGSYVVISHDGGLATLYGHLNVVKVVVGQQVNQAQRIGLEGSTGISTGPHVHFEVRLGGVPTDPLPYVPRA